MISHACPSNDTRLRCCTARLTKYWCNDATHVFTAGTSHGGSGELQTSSLAAHQNTRHCDRSSTRHSQYYHVVPRTCINYSNNYSDQGALCASRATWQHHVLPTDNPITLSIAVPLSSSCHCLRFDWPRPKPGQDKETDREMMASARV